MHMYTWNTCNQRLRLVNVVHLSMKQIPIVSICSVPIDKTDDRKALPHLVGLAWVKYGRIQNIWVTRTVKHFIAHVCDLLLQVSHMFDIHFKTHLEVLHHKSTSQSLDFCYWSDIYLIWRDTQLQRNSWWPQDKLLSPQMCPFESGRFCHDIFTTVQYLLVSMRLLLDKESRNETFLDW